MAHWFIGRYLNDFFVENWHFQQNYKFHRKKNGIYMIEMFKFQPLPS